MKYYAQYDPETMHIIDFYKFEDNEPITLKNRLEVTQQDYEIAKEFPIAAHTKFKIENQKVVSYDDFSIYTK